MISEDIKDNELQEYLGLITLVCKSAGVKIVIIDGRIFAIIEFNEASNSAHKHELRGRDITDLLRQYKHAPTAAGVATLAQQIDSTDKTTRLWDRSFPFRMFVPPV